MVVSLCCIYFLSVLWKVSEWVGVSSGYITISFFCHLGDPNPRTGGDLFFWVIRGKSHDLPLAKHSRVALILVSFCSCKGNCIPNGNLCVIIKDNDNPRWLPLPISNCLQHIPIKMRIGTHTQQLHTQIHSPRPSTNQPTIIPTTDWRPYSQWYPIKKVFISLIGTTNRWLENNYEHKEGSKHENWTKSDRGKKRNKFLCKW